MKSDSLNPVLSLAVCALLWSSGGVLIKLVAWNPVCIAGIRSLLGVFVLCLIVRRLPRGIVRRNNGTVDRGSTLNMIAAGVLYAGTMICFVSATKKTTAANAILLQYTNAIYVIVFGPLLLHEKNDWIDFAAVAGIIGGMILLFSGDIGGGSTTGNIFALLSGAMYGFTTIFLRRQKNGHPVDSLILAHLLTFVFSIPWLINAQLPSYGSWGGLALLGVLQVGVPSALLALGITKVPALSSVIITMIEPLMNPLWVALIVHEIPSAQSMGGGCIILGCIVIHVALKARKAFVLQRKRKK